MQKTYFFGTYNHLLKNAINKHCSEFNKKIFWENFFSGIPDPDFDPDSIFSGFLEFFESVAYIKHFCRRIFELCQIDSLWTGMYYITSPLCTAWKREKEVNDIVYGLSFFLCFALLLFFRLSISGFVEAC